MMLEVKGRKTVIQNMKIKSKNMSDAKAVTKAGVEAARATILAMTEATEDSRT